MAIASFDVSLEGVFKGSYQYVPTVVLTETSEKSSAHLTDFIFYGEGWTSVVSNNAPLGQGCFLTPESKVVPPGQSWNIELMYVYCRDLTSNREMGGSQVFLEVRYTDDNGVAGAVTGTATMPVLQP